MISFFLDVEGDYVALVACEPGRIPWLAAGRMDAGERVYSFAKPLTLPRAAVVAYMLEEGQDVNPHLCRRPCPHCDGRRVERLYNRCVVCLGEGLVTDRTTRLYRRGGEEAARSLTSWLMGTWND